MIDPDSEDTVIVYTDGSSWNGQGGWAFYMRFQGQQAIRYGFKKAKATNNQMELTAILRALQHVPASNRHRFPILLYTDSQYCQKALTQWVWSWAKHGWKTSNGSPVKNKGLVLKTAVLLRHHQTFREVEIRWVRGHSGIPENEMVDSSANNARKNGVTNWSKKDLLTRLEYHPPGGD